MDQEKRQYGPAEGEEIKYLRNHLPVPARRAHSVMEFDLQEEDLAPGDEDDFDFDIDDDDDFDL